MTNCNLWDCSIQKSARRYTNFMKCNRRNFLRGLTVSTLTASGLFGSRQQTEMKPSNLSGQSNSSPQDLSRLLKCIAQVETGNDDTKVGPKGERSRYQITEDVWWDRLSEPGNKWWRYRFRTECSGHIAEQVAMRHLVWLRNNLIDFPKPITQPFWLAFAWHAGLERTLLELRGASVTPELYDYARRVTNLYLDANNCPKS
jgi:hypothetical protein